VLTRGQREIAKKDMIAQDNRGKGIIHAPIVTKKWNEAQGLGGDTINRPPKEGGKWGRVMGLTRNSPRRGSLGADVGPTYRWPSFEGESGTTVNTQEWVEVTRIAAARLVKERFCTLHAEDR